MFSERLQEARIDAGLKQSDIAKEIGLTTSAYGYYEQGKREPNLETLMKLCSILNVSSDYLLGIDDVNEHQESISSSNSTNLKNSIYFIDQQIRRSIAHNITFFRKKKNYTQQYLAILLHNRASTVSMWECGAYIPDITTLFKICKALKVSIIDIIGQDAIDSSDTIPISRFEKEIILAYRNSDDIDRTIIHRTLGLSTETTIEENDKKAMGK